MSYLSSDVVFDLVCWSSLLATAIDVVGLSVE